jgi:hypothetical protein
LESWGGRISAFEVDWKVHPPKERSAFFFRRESPGVPEVEDYPAEDAGVCNVEGRPAIGAYQEIEEVDDVAETKSVDEVAEDAGADESEDKLHVGRLEVQGFAVEEDSEEGNDGEPGEKPAVAFENSPGGSIVMDMTDTEEVSPDRITLVKVKRGMNQMLGILVCCQCTNEDGPKQSVGL